MSYRILLPEKAGVDIDATSAVADGAAASSGNAKPHPVPDSTTAAAATASACSTAVAGGEAFCAESASKETTAAPCAGVWGGVEVRLRFGRVKRVVAAAV